MAGDVVQMDSRPRTAVVLFNLGGPDDQESVRPFLFNLFKDPAIIAAPGPVRLGLAWLISTLRDKSARANYALMGGGSPLLPETEAQARALTNTLNARAPDREWGAFIAMRYWKPFVKDAAEAVRAFAPDEIVLLPLYPQFSTTTTGSSLTEWNRVWDSQADVRSRGVCCYPDVKGLADAYADLIRSSWLEAGSPDNVRVLFSAHGLPEATVARGDPYPDQVALTAAEISMRLPEFADTQICYQSRVGPMKWIGPATEEEITRAAHEGKTVLVCPIAFVSEHVETLVELDIEYRAIAEAEGAAGYIRAPAVGTHPRFIEALADLVLGTGEGLRPANPAVRCNGGIAGCPLRA